MPRYPMHWQPVHAKPDSALSQISTPPICASGGLPPCATYSSSIRYCKGVSYIYRNQ
jgi:hypothetical protein